MALAFAFDRAATSGRYLDIDGRLHVPESVISRAEVSGYLGRELISAGATGLDPDRMYAMLRPPGELMKAARSFHGVPLLSRHVPVSAQNPQREYIIGTVLNPHFEEPFLKAELVFWDALAIGRVEAMEAKKAGQALSCGYRFSPIMRDFTYEGQHADGLMVNLVGNHVAAVESARVTTAMVGDGAPALTSFEAAARYAPGLHAVGIGYPQPRYF
jgi:uncharacterized protein